MTTLQPGDQAPDFTLPADGGDTINLSALRGHKVILYFYPKDDTPGCTKEACGFNEALPQFEKTGAKIIGISKCSIATHDKFKAKYDLNFPLASDENADICTQYGTWVEKNMYGRKYMGIQRTTFLIDENGTIMKIWPKVKVADHAEDVMNVITGQEKTT